MTKYQYNLPKVNLRMSLCVGMFLFPILLGNASVLITEDKIWEYSNLETHEQTNRRFTRYKFSGTETVAGKTFHRLMRIYECGLESVSFTEWKFEPYETYEEKCVALMREENDKVYLLLDPHLRYYIYNRIEGSYPGKGLDYYHIPGSDILNITEGDDILLYDFSENADRELALGYSLELAQERNFSAFMNVLGFQNRDRIEMATINNEDIEVYYITHEYLEDMFSWNKGDPARYQFIYTKEFGNIGRGTLFQLTNEEPIDSSGNDIKREDTSRLNRVLDLEGNVLYSTPDTKDPSAIMELKTDSIMEHRIFDLMGREIHNPHQGTIYIRAGKKFVAK